MQSKFFIAFLSSIIIPIYLYFVILPFNKSFFPGNLFKYSKLQEYKKENKDIKLFLANNTYSEIENVAKEILYLIKNDGYDYKDINIVTDCIEVYDNEVKIICDKYNIPIIIIF